jgi:hypothetical protein
MSVERGLVRAERFSKEKKVGLATTADPGSEGREGCWWCQMGVVDGVVVCVGGGGASATTAGH